MYHVSPTVRITSLSILTLAAALLFTACKPPEPKAAASGGLAVSIVLAGSPVVGNVPVLIEVSDAGTPVSGATVKVTGDMTHAGMQPVTATASETQPGSYRAESFAFTMAGDWIVTVDVSTSSGSRARTELLTTVAPK
ncbi:MAG TPA: FixH family protein [Trueperaceae bacterium]|nr:FixH family protein [Trueperaceae bacterium]